MDSTHTILYGAVEYIRLYVRMSIGSHERIGARAGRYATDVHARGTTFHVLDRSIIRVRAREAPTRHAMFDVRYIQL